MYRTLLRRSIPIAAFVLGCAPALAIGNRADSPLTLEETVRFALDAEPGFAAMEMRARAKEELTVADRTLPDPQLAVGILNVPGDSFSLRQEPMTQFRIGVKQAFPRGKTRAIKSEIEALDGEMATSDANLRRRQVARDVSLLWLDLHYWLDTLATVRQNRTFFADLVEITRSLYTVGKRDQQDLIHSQLQVSRLDEKIVSVEENVRRARNQLSRWIDPVEASRQLAEDLPLEPPASIDAEGWILQHPAMRAIDLKIESGVKGVELARQEYKPGWSLDVAYAVRQDDPLGQARSDFLSATVGLELPLFTEDRQDRRVRAMEYNTESLRNTRIEALRHMQSDLNAWVGDYEQTRRRVRIFEGELMPQVEQRSKAALNAYQADAADFADVMTAYIDRLNTRIDYRMMQIRGQKLLAQIYYYKPDGDTAGGSAQ